MPTVEQIVTRAYRKIGVTGSGDAPTGEELAEGVDALNAMIHGWNIRGVPIAWSDQNAGEEINLPAEYHEGVVYLLAGRLSPDYMAPPSFDADDWFRAIQAAEMVIDEAAMPGGIRGLPSQQTYQKRAYLSGT